VYEMVQTWELGETEEALSSVIQTCSTIAIGECADTVFQHI
jgi:hypothetical protein